MDELVKKLQYAKDAVRWLLDHENGTVDFHGIGFWAAEVERLRQEVKNTL
jgi:hypothetical protein